MKKRTKYRVVTITGVLLVSTVIAGGIALRSWISTPSITLEPAFSRVSQSISFDGSPNSYLDFSCRSSASVFQSLLPSQNLLYSPASLYLSLAMLSECADGKTKQEILAALCADEVQDCSIQVEHLLQNSAGQRTSGVPLLSNSIWINCNTVPDRELLERLSRNYDASCFQLDFQLSASQKRLQAWLQDASAGTLSSDSYQLRPMDTCCLFSTIYFQDHWQMPMDPELTQSGTFTQTDGRRIPCELMHTDLYHHSAIVTDRYTATHLPFQNGCKLYLILPSKGVPIEELVSDPSLWSLNRQGTSVATVHLDVPKFDLSTEINCMNLAQRLGIERAFSTSGDFARLGGGFLCSFQQKSSIRIDENGCKVATATEISIASGSEPSQPEELTLVFDRPFLLLFTSQDGTPFLVGIVNQPLNQL